MDKQRQRGQQPLAEHLSISIQAPAPDPATAPSSKRQPLIVVGRDLSGLSPELLFCLGCAGVLGLYTVYGAVLEFIFRTPGMRPHGAYLTFMQFLLYALFGFVEQTAVSRALPNAIPWRTYSLLAFLSVTTMVCSNSALGYLSYPTQVIIKCCKLIPTMIGGILIQGKRYNAYDVVAMFCMIFGCAWFTLGDVKVQPNFHFFGILLMCFALCADGAIGNVQERTMKAFNHSAAEVILYTNAIGTVYIGAGLLVTNQLRAGLALTLEHKLRIFGGTLILSTAGYLGTQFVLLLVKSYGALPAVTVTTCRKALTIVLSFLLFTKPFTMQYVWAGLLVVCGIYLNLYSKNKDRWDAALTEQYSRLVARLKGKRVLSLQTFGKAATV